MPDLTKVAETATMFTRTLNALIAHRKLSAITRCCIGVSPAGPLATEGCYTTSNQGTAVDECIAQWRTNQKKTKRSRKGDTNVHDVKEALKNLRLNKQCQNRKVKFLETPLYSSTVFVVIVEYNKKQSNAMDNAWPDLELEIDQIPAAGAGGGAGARRCAVQRLLSKAKFPKNTFTQACLLSATTYEGEVLHGTLVPDTSAVKKTTIVAFAEPPYLAETKAARKLLEMSSDALALTTTAAGKLNKLVRLNEPKPDTTAVRFVNQLQWELKIGTTIRYTISANTVAVPAPKISKTELSARLTSTFGQTCDKNAIWDIVEAAIKQHHGTMVVISDHAAKEAERLGSQSTRLCNPIKIRAEHIDAVTSIDGAFLVDRKGKCHALGVILDGQATKFGSRARGARYNSGVRYESLATSQKQKCLVVIVSEDGYVDIRPDPVESKPKKRKRTRASGGGAK